MQTLVRFGPQNRLVGVLSEPAGAGGWPVVVLPSAGLQPRFGPFRLHVELARRLASRGIGTFRFDVPGVGEATRLDGCGSREAVRAALDALSQRHGARRFVVGGVCSAADLAWSAAVDDARVCGMLMLDGLVFAGPWLRWGKVAGALRRSPLHWPGIALRMLGRRMRPQEHVALMENYRDWPSREQARHDFARMLDRDARSLWIYTGGYASMFRHPRQFAWSFGPGVADPRVSMLYWPDCDHTFFARSHRDRALQAIEHWLGSAFANREDE